MDDMEEIERKKEEARRRVDAVYQAMSHEAWLRLWDDKFPGLRKGLGVPRERFLAEQHRYLEQRVWMETREVGDYSEIKVR